MIEIGVHPDMPTAMMWHSTDSGQFMASNREEAAEFVAAAKRGHLDGLFTDPPTHTSASAAAPTTEGIPS